MAQPKHSVCLCRARLLEGGAALMQGMNVLMMRTLNHCDQ